MLKDIVVGLYAAAAFVAYLSGLVSFAWLAAALAVITYYYARQITVSHRFEKQLNHLGVRLLQILIGITLLGLVVVWLSPVGIHDAAALWSLIIIAALPSAFLIAIGASALEHHKKTRQNVISTALRSNLTLCMTLVCFLMLGSMLGLVKHIPIALHADQLVLLYGALVIPLHAMLLKDSNTKHKAAHTKPVFMDQQLIQRLAVIGLAGGVIGIGNYLFFFARHLIAPNNIEQTLPLYQQATTLTFLTFLLYGFAIILFERADTHEKFFTDYLLSNKRLLKSFLACLAIAVLVIYVPFLRAAFKTQPLDAIDWLSAVLAASIYALMRLLQRHTRQHSRNEVVRLHQSQTR